MELNNCCRYFGVLIIQDAFFGHLSASLKRLYSLALFYSLGCTIVVLPVTRDTAMRHLRLLASVGPQADSDPESALYYLEVVSQTAHEPILWLTAKVVTESRFCVRHLRASHSATVVSILDTHRVIAQARDALERMQLRAHHRALAWSLFGS